MSKLKQAIAITGVVLSFISAVCAAIDNGADSVTKIQKIREGR